MKPTDWITALRTGNNEPLHLIFEKYGVLCISRLQRHVKCSKEDAEDIFADALLIFRRHALNGTVQALEAPEKYFYTLCFNQHRARQQQQARRVHHHKDMAQQLYYPYHTPPQSEIDIQEADKKQLTTIMLTALGSLGQNCQRVLKFFYIEKLSMEEIASQMGWASADVAKTTKSRCYRKWMQYSKKIEAELEKDTSIRVEK